MPQGLVSRWIRFKTGNRAIGGEAYQAKFGIKDIQIPIDQRPMMEAHIDNFIKCMRTREKPHLDVETGAKAEQPAK